MQSAHTFTSRFIIQIHNSVVRYRGVPKLKYFLPKGPCARMKKPSGGFLYLDCVSVRPIALRASAFPKHLFRKKSIALSNVD